MFLVFGPFMKFACNSLIFIRYLTLIFLFGLMIPFLVLSHQGWCKSSEVEKLMQ